MEALPPLGRQIWKREHRITTRDDKRVSGYRKSKEAFPAGHQSRQDHRES